MMSHYGVPYEYEADWIDEDLELSIETLAGTAFEIKVSPDDTIMTIKSKIQSVEGIPVSQQHLLYNLEELDNSASVSDYSIQNGATLKLVLSMRGGPISTKRLPPADEMAWREFQELMSVTRKDDLFERMPSGSRVNVLVFRDGDQVNLLRVIENEDGSFSPLTESWNGTSIRNLFAEEDPDESAKRFQENSVTMGKMQELKEKLETLSIQRKEKKTEDSASSVVVESSSPPSLGCQVSEDTEEASRRHAFVNFPSGDYTRWNCVKLIRRPEQEADEITNLRPRSRLVSCSKASMAALTKARKEAENIIRMQSNLSVLVDTEPSQGYGLRRTPLPDIRRSPRHHDKEDDKKSDDEDLGKNLREKTARSFAIVEEENDVATTGPSICSSQSSIVASNEVAIACPPIPREGVSTTVGRSRFRVSRYVLDNDERPKTTPGKLDAREATSSGNRSFCSHATDSDGRKRTTHIWYSNVLPRASSKSQVHVHDHGDDDKKKSEPNRSQPKKRASTLVRNPSFREEVLIPPSPPAQKLPPPVVKKRLRCSLCKKKLNITNTYTCRCGRMFCAVHRYSEVHNCLFDYKEEGRKILQQTNPLVAASKLPKI